MNKYEHVTTGNVVRSPKLGFEMINESKKLTKKVRSLLSLVSNQNGRYGKNAVVYVATQRKYVTEANKSVLGLRNHNPDVVTYLKAPMEILNPEDKKLYDEVIDFSNPLHGFMDKCSFLEGVKERRVLFLDGDTMICGSLVEGFDLLKRFDLAAAHAPIRTYRNDDKNTSAFTEFNTGVIFTRNTSRIKRILSRWPNYCKPNESHDQPSFRRMIWENKVNIYVLPPEYNARLIFPTFVSGAVKIIHARLPN